MNIRLLKNKKGVIITRQPTIIAGDLRLTFLGLPEGVRAEAAFKNSKNNELYRVLSDNSCVVPNTFLLCGDMSTRIVLSAAEGQNRDCGQVYVCESIKVQLLKGGDVLVCPSDNYLPDRTVQTELAIGNILDEISTIKTRLDGLEEKLSQLLEGYDVE